jgi:hypothetical protein
MRYGDQSSTVAQIQSARQAMRVLDAEIARTEARLRAMPAMVNPALGGTVSGGASRKATAAQRMASRRAQTMPKLFMVTDDGARLGAFKTGQTGLAMSPGVLKAMYGSGYAAAAFHVVAGVGNQIMNLQDRQRELERQGVSVANRRSQAGLDVIGGISKGVADIFGVNAMAEMLLRPALGREEAQKSVARVWRDAFENEGVKRARMERTRRRLAAAGEDVTKQFMDDLAFLNAWTPTDFDVGDDYGYAILNDELHTKNKLYITALHDLRLNQALDAAINDGGDS